MRCEELQSMASTSEVESLRPCAALHEISSHPIAIFQLAFWRCELPRSRVWPYMQVSSFVSVIKECTRIIRLRRHRSGRSRCRRTIVLNMEFLHVFSEWAHIPELKHFLSDCTPNSRLFASVVFGLNRTLRAQPDSNVCTHHVVSMYT